MQFQLFDSSCRQVNSLWDSKCHLHDCHDVARSGNRLKLSQPLGTMATKTEKNSSSSVTTQTELVTSPILWQCLYVIRTVAEFRNLAFRVTKTRNDTEVVVVYREGISGIFGPPVDPITLTLEPNGKCLLAILFKPVQRVSIVSADSGQIEIASLLAVLRMIAGKGYLFCPGLPEKYLAGKACGKFVVLHRVPFKRFQSNQCPVYYQTPLFQQNNAKSSLCALCPRCMQTAKWIQSLPVFASNSAATAMPQPVHLPAFNHLRPDQRSGASDDSRSDNNSKMGSTVPPTSISRLLSLAASYTNTTASSSNAPQIVKVDISSIGLARQVSGMDVNGNNQTTVALKRANSVPAASVGEVGTKDTTMSELQAVSASLRNILQERSRQRMLGLSGSTGPSKGANGVTENVVKAQVKKSGKGKKSRSHVNICRQCKKQFSTPASLLNHLQRHEGLSGSWKKQLRERRRNKKLETSSSVLRMVFRGSKSQSLLSRKKSSGLSETSIRLFLKCLNDMIPSQNGAKSLKQQGLSALGDGKAKRETADKQSESEKSQLVSKDQAENEILKKPGLKRTASGLSAMQTLLEAAAIAGGGPEDVSSPTISSSSSYAPKNNLEVAAASTTSLSPTLPTEHSDGSDIPSKKPRKSSRLASRRARGKQKKKGDEDSNNEPSVENAAVSHDQSMLTNLNLLSTVSLETAMREKPQSPFSSQISTSSSVPFTVLSPPVKSSTAAYPSVRNATLPTSTFNGSRPLPTTSQSVSIPQHVLNNTSGGNVLVSKAQDKQPFNGVNSSSTTSSGLPPVPPLLFAGAMQGAGQMYPSFSSSSAQQKLGQSQSVPTSPSSILRSLVSVNSSQPVTPAPEGDPSKSNLSSSDCGAIDLSKPKPSLAHPSIPSSLEKSLDLSSLSGLPHNVAQLVAGNDNPVEMLQYLMMMSKTPGSSAPAQKESLPLTSIISDKQADSDLQARMFASARNYKLERTMKTSPQVQAVIASTSRLAQSGKGPKPATGLAGQGDEIQCGYKWSGSGGLVKERTQMVRELVPSDVMANFLSKPLPPATIPQPQVVNLSQPQRQPAQVVQSSPSEQQPSSKPQDLSTSQLALNLTTSKPAEAPSPRKGGPGRPKKSTPAVVIASSPPAPQWSPSSPGSTPRSILRSSLLNPTALITQLMGGTRFPAPIDTASPQRFQHKAMNLSQTSSPSPSHPTTPTSPSNCTISSPSLAAMLRQPAAAIHEVNHSDVLRSVSSPATTGQRQSVITTEAAISLPGGVQVKTEPVDRFLPEDGMIIMSLPVKSERRDTSADRAAAEVSREADSPTSLVMDIRPDSTTPKDTGEQVKSGTSAKSRTKELDSKKATVKCEN